jgi:hypothetical protein
VCDALVRSLGASYLADISHEDGFGGEVVAA